MNETTVHSVPDGKKGMGILSPETWIITIGVLLLVFFAVKRFDYSFAVRNEARVKKELSRIHELEQGYMLENSRFGSSKDIGFVEKYPYVGIRYTIQNDSTNFTAPPKNCEP